MSYVPNVLELVLVLNVLGWVATGVLAARKGRNWLGWTGLAVVLTSLVIVVLALLPDRRASVMTTR